MKRLWVLRHAKSSWDDPAPADHDRPLAPRGRKAAKRIARWAAENDVRPELVLCSTAVRARATLDAVRGSLGDPEEQLEEGLYHAWAAELLGRLQALPEGVGEVMLVGHNPGLHELVCLLAPPGPAELPTGALAELELAVDHWPDLAAGCGALRQLILPRALPG